MADVRISIKDLFARSRMSSKELAAADRLERWNRQLRRNAAAEPGDPVAEPMRDTHWSIEQMLGLNEAECGE